MFMQLKYYLCAMVTESNELSESICRESKVINPSYLDSNNILWQIVNNEWIGKRSVDTADFRVCWIDDLKGCKIRNYLCGIDADYKEVFRR